MSLVACRCCLSDYCYKDMDSEYFYGGEREVYSEMLKTTFDIAVLRQNIKCLICEDCIKSLRSAAIFKSQVLQAEAVMLQRLQDNIPDLKLEVKAERCDDITSNLDFATANSRATTDEEDEFVDELDTAASDYINGTLDTVNKLPEININGRRGTNRTPAEKKKKVKVKREQDTKNNKLKNNLRKQNDTTKEQDNDGTDQRKTLYLALKDIKEDTVNLVINSNMCVFRSAKTKYRCFACSQAFLTIAELRTHNETHSNKTVTLQLRRLRTKCYTCVDISHLVCKLCKQSTEDLISLKRHLSDTHSISFTGDVNLLIPYKLEDGYRCLICKCEFSGFFTLSVHMNTHYKNHVCDTCGATFISATGLRNHIHYVHGMNKCALCPAVFTSIYGRERHMVKAHDKRAYETRCVHCDKSFKYGYQLKRHRIEDHGETKPVFICSLCDKTFHVKHNLEIHIKGVHMKERRFSCEVCAMVFFTKYDLKRHGMSHGDAKPYACAGCATRFKTRDSWRRHERRQHGGAGNDKINKH